MYFFVVWFFVLFEFFGCSFFAVWAGAWAPPKQQKKTRPRPNSKKINTTPPLPSVFFLLFGRVDVFIFLLFGPGACFFFRCLGHWFFFLLFGQGPVFVAVWAVGVFIFFLFGRGACSFFAVWAGNGSSLTYPSAWFVFKRPSNKKDQTATKKKHEFQKCQASSIQASNHLHGVFQALPQQGSRGLQKPPEAFRGLSALFL